MKRLRGVVARRDVSVSVKTLWERLGQRSEFAPGPTVRARHGVPTQLICSNKCSNMVG